MAILRLAHSSNGGTPPRSNPQGEHRPDDALVRAATALRNGQRPGERHEQLVALGKDSTRRYRDLVEHFAQRERDPTLAALALQILCSMWGDTGRYLRVVEQYVAGVPWDADDEVRSTALTIAGEYLRDAQEPTLLGRLVGIVDDEDEHELVRTDAYVALARAMGQEWDDLPRPTAVPRFRELVDPSLVQAARDRRAREGESLKSTPARRDPRLVDRDR